MIKYWNSILQLAAVTSLILVPSSPYIVSNVSPALAVTEPGTKFDLKAYIGAKLPAINKALRESVVSNEPETKTIVESMMYTLMAGGKRLRPVMCLAAAELFTSEDVEAKAMAAAVALEMINTFTVIHDDLPCMDNGTVRRGKPANHVRYDPPYPWLE
jgi:geranylgeranyl diphosphate synthase, type II